MCDICTSAAPTENRLVLTEMGLRWMALCAVCIKRLTWM